MTKIEKAVARYESARQLVSELKGKRALLISQCERVDTCEGLHGEIVPFGDLCLVVAFNEMVQLNQDAEFGYTYEESLFSSIYDGEGGCDSCLASYKLKVGPLAAARKEFGAAKRSLSAIGKRLMREKP